MLDRVQWAWLLSGAMGVPPAEVPTGPPWELHITWEAPSSCPDADTIREHARVRLSGWGEPVTAVGTVSGSDAEGWQLVLRVEGPHGIDERQVHATSCKELGEAAGLFIAVAADPNADAGATEPPAPVPEPEPATEPEPAAEPESEPPPEPEPEPQPQPTLESQPEPEPPRETSVSSGWRGLVRLEGSARFLRVLPEPVGADVGGAIGLWPGRPWLRLEARARYSFGQRITYDDGIVGGDFDLWVAGASGCFEPRRGAFSFPLCAGLELGSMRGASFGVQEPGSASSLHVGLPLEAAVTWAPLPWLAVWLSPRASVSLRRPRFHVRDLEVLFRAGPAALRVVAGLELRFPRENP